MRNVIVTNDSVLVRSLGAATRLADQVAGVTEITDRGVLIETMLGRYVLDRDARAIWLLIDGRRSVGQVVEALAESGSVPAGQLGQPVRELCTRLVELGLAELADGKDRAAIS